MHFMRSILGPYGMPDGMEKVVEEQIQNRKKGHDLHENCKRLKPAALAKEHKPIQRHEPPRYTQVVA